MVCWVIDVHVVQQGLFYLLTAYTYILTDIVRYCDLPPSVVNDMAGRTPSESYFHFGEIRKLVAESLFSMVINLVGVP